MLQATPTLWQALASQLQAAGVTGAGGAAALAGLRMLVGGEALSGGLARTLCELGGAVANLYGPTETTIWSAALRAAMPRRWCGDGRGRAADWFTDLEHADLCAGRGLGPVPVGVVGELYIAGLGCCAGLSGSVWSDGGAVCCGPVWGSGEPDVPDRGSGAVALGRCAGVLSVARTRS